MNIEQKRRELFEAWAAKHNAFIREDDIDGGPEDIRLDRQGGVYIWANAESAWYAFNAALDAVVIQLPSPISAHNTDVNGFVNPAAVEYDECIEDCRDAIESTGLGLKVSP